MNYGKWILIAFCIVVLIQLAIPLSMIFSREDTIATGQVFRFVTTPVDPTDPFRGKYITLSFAVNNVPAPHIKSDYHERTFYLVLGNDSNGFAKVDSVEQTPPVGISNYIKVHGYCNEGYKSDNGKRLSITYPFNRFYMEESKAPAAEAIHRTAMRDTTSSTYALVSVKNGDAVVTDVLVNGTSIRTLSMPK